MKKVKITVKENSGHIIFVASDQSPAKRLPDGSVPKKQTTPNRSVRHPESIRQILELSQSLTSYEISFLTEWAQELRG